MLNRFEKPFLKVLFSYISITTHGK